MLDPEDPLGPPAPPGPEHRPDAPAPTTQPGSDETAARYRDYFGSQPDGAIGSRR